MVINSYSKKLALLLIAAVMTGCAGLQSSRDIVEGVNFDRVESDVAAVSNVYLHRTDSGMDLHGELKRKSSARGPIPGHLHVSLLDAQGNFLKGADIDYKRHNKQSNHSHFSIALPITMESGSTVRIAHMASERSDLGDHPQWVDSPKH